MSWWASHFRGCRQVSSCHAESRRAQLDERADIVVLTDQPRYGKRTTASGLQIAIGNVSGVMAPFVSNLPERLVVEVLTDTAALQNGRGS